MVNTDTFLTTPYVYEGFHLLLAVNPVGVISGFAFGAASTTDQPLADTFFALRRSPHPRVPSVGGPALGL